MAAALLNLTGLGLGYAYLRRWWRAALSVAGVGALGYVATVVDAADQPWLWRAIAVVVAASLAFDGWRLARRTGPAAATGGRVRPAAVVGGVLVGLLVAGYLTYAAAGRQVYADGLAAQGRADCRSAILKFETVAEAYELTLSSDVPAARANTVLCRAFLAASDARSAGAYADAVTRYRDLRAAGPGPLLAPFVQADLVRTLTDWAASRRAAGDYPEAVRVYREVMAESGSGQVREDIAATLLEQAAVARGNLPGGAASVAPVRTAVEALGTIQREFPDVPSAAQVPQALLDTVTAATADLPAGRFCEAIPVLDYLVTVPDAAAAVAGTADGQRAQAMLECGLGHFRSRVFPAAIQQLDALVAAYPDAPQVAQARSASIAATIAAETTYRKEIPLPAPLGGDSPGRNPITFYNDSPREVKVLLAGSTAHAFTLPACPTCPAEYTTPDDACPTFDGRPSATLRLSPGEYYLLADDPADAEVTKLTSLVIVSANYTYTNCLHVEQRKPYQYDPYRYPLLPPLRIPELAKPR